MCKIVPILRIASSSVGITKSQVAMKHIFRQVNAFVKGVVLYSKPHRFLGFLNRPFLFISNTLSLSKWISAQDHSNVYNDFYTPKRDLARRYFLYQHLVKRFELDTLPIEYLEFGVANGLSFKWWVAHCKHSDSRFYGFDTFAGLPESWGTFTKGDLAADVPVVDDERVQFFKGLFQQSLPAFFKTVSLDDSKRKVIHFDADLFSSTLFTISSLAPYLKKGDILVFDEFNVPNHEFLALKTFCDSYYVKVKLLGAVNNYFQVAVMIE